MYFLNCIKVSIKLNRNPGILSAGILSPGILSVPRGGCFSSNERPISKSDYQPILQRLAIVWDTATLCDRDSRRIINIIIKRIFYAPNVTKNSET